MERLTSIADVQRFLRQNQRPIYYIGHTTHHLLGIDAWVNSFTYICRVDCFDGRHPNIFAPPDIGHDDVPEEEVVNRLLRHKDVVDFIARGGGDPAAVFLMFDEETEAICADRGIEIWSPSASARARYGDKVATVRTGDAAGAPSVPNALANVGSYEGLLRLAERAGLGHDLVVQTPFGVSGQSTFFISNEAQWQQHAAQIVAEREVKVMKRINCRSSTLEACVTGCGTVVGPLLSEIIGHEDLTPKEGAWYGNEVFPEAFPEKVRAKARDHAAKFGDQLLKDGYRGYFDVDFLIDQDNGEVYLGELNPRVTGASPVTSRADRAGLPLFLFHLLEFSGVGFDLDVEALNARWADPRFIDSCSELVVASIEDGPSIVTEAPPSGIWRLGDEGEVTYRRFDYLGTVGTASGSEREAFFLRVTGPGDVRFRGAGLGILMTPGRLTTDDGTLNHTARAWIRGLTAHYRTRPLEPQ
jgi:D-alanine-D-alanine ligase-like ATP-grasp enzyme